MIDLLIAGIIAASHHGGGHHSHHARSAGQVIEGCSYDSEADSGGLWIYPDGSLCRGTGEDPTVDSQGLPACADGRLAVPKDGGRVTCVLPSSVRLSHDDRDDEYDSYDSEEVHSHGHGGHHSGSHHSRRA